MHSTPTILSKIIPPAFLIILEEEDVLSVLKQVAQYTGFHLLCSASGVSIWTRGQQRWSYLKSCYT